MVPSHRKYPLLMQLLALLTVVVLALPAGVAVAAPPAQETPATAVGLGEYVFVDAAADETLAYAIAIPEGGTYIVSRVDDAAAADFDLRVTDAAGNEVYNDVFESTELTLETGTVLLEFTAVADQTLGFVALGQIGAMSSDENQPGRLYPGSIYTEERVNDARYATVSVPETSYPQQVLIYVETGEEDTFYATIESENSYHSITTDTENLLHFWTHGGDVKIYLEPYDRRSTFTLIVFLSGKPAKLQLDTPVEGSLPAGATETIFELELTANYTDLSLLAEGDEFLDVMLVDRYYNSNVSYDTYGSDELLIDSLFAGVYYVFVRTDEAFEGDVAFTLTATGDAGRPVEQLFNGEPYADEFTADDESITYAFDVTTAGALVTFAMEGDDETDFDMNAGLRPGDYTYSSYSYGSNESLTFMAPVTGTYYLTIIGNGNEGAFTLTATEGDLAPELVSGELTYGEYAGGDRVVYRLVADAPGSMLSVALVGPDDVDLDLAVAAYDAEGNSTLSLGGYSSGSVEIVSYVLPAAGLYEVAINASYADAPGSFFVRAQIDDPRLFGGQWAVDATASSQFGDPQSGPLQATGPSDTAYAGDAVTAWASLDPDAGDETLELTYAYPVFPTGVAIVESYNPGAVVMVEALNIDSGEWVVLYEGEAAPTEEPYRVFRPELTPADFKTDSLRLTLDSAAVAGWNEIDAVQLFGRP